MCLSTKRNLNTSTSNWAHLRQTPAFTWHVQHFNRLLQVNIAAFDHVYLANKLYNCLLAFDALRLNMSKTPTNNLMLLPSCVAAALTKSAKSPYNHDTAVLIFHNSSALAFVLLSVTLVVAATAVAVAAAAASVAWLAPCTVCVRNDGASPRDERKVKAPLPREEDMHWCHACVVGHLTPIHRHEELKTS